LTELVHQESKVHQDSDLREVPRSHRPQLNTAPRQQVSTARTPHHLFVDNYIEAEIPEAK